VLVVGEKEQESGKVAVRKYQEGDLGAMDIDEIITTLVKNIKNRTL
jgi:threonyl-tRNA synthetase